MADINFAFAFKHNADFQKPLSNNQPGINNKDPSL